MKFEIPVPLKIGLLVIGATALYTYIGQLVPQKRVEAPQETVMADDMTPDDLVGVGRQIAEGKGLCFTCHTVGKSGALRFPDLDSIATKAETRIEGMEALQYLAQSIYEPDVFIVDGFNPGMPKIDKPPIALNDQEILAVIAYLQSLGGAPTVTLEVTKADLGVE
jgi:mono/diheme cytochrome c family protein